LHQDHLLLIRLGTYLQAFRTSQPFLQKYERHLLLLSCTYHLRRFQMQLRPLQVEDRKSTRLNSSHVSISYAVFCLKKKNTTSSSAVGMRPEPGHKGIESL